MSTVKVPNNKAGRDNRPAAPPIKDDGGLYSYVYYPMDYHYAYYADTITELIQGFIPNYTLLDEESKKDARASYILEVLFSMRLQTYQIASNLDDLELDEWEDNELRYHNNLRHIPQNWDEEKNNVWVSTAPLILLKEDYSPFTKIVAPEPISYDENENPENLIWLTYSDEKEFLYSLSAISAVLVGKPEYAASQRQSIKR